MDITKQKLLLSYLVNDPKLYTLCQPIIDARQFDPTLRKTVDYLKAYYQKYSALPTPEQILADTALAIQPKPNSDTINQYAADEIEQFCKQKEAELAVIEGAKLVREGKYEQVVDLVRRAAMISLHRDLGIDLYQDALTAISEIRSNDLPFSTTLHDLDDILDGGLVRKQMLLVSANSGGGKSILMANLALAMSQAHQLDVLIISLELSQTLIWARLATMLTGVPTKEWRGTTDDTMEHVFQNLASKNTCRFIIKRLPNGSNANDVRSYLRQYHGVYGKYPDLLVTDYMDCMTPVRNVDVANVSQRDKAVGEELYEIGVDYNMINITASQQNRGAITATHLDQSVIAGGLSKINVTDVYLSIILTDAMRAGGKIALQALKTRSSGGVGKVVTLDWNAIALTITNETNKKQSSSPFVSVTSKLDNLSLLDIM